jgi:GNAT superfamily N-acetyltransferase
MAGTEGMELEIHEESREALPEYARVSIAFRVTRVLEVQLEDGGLGGVRLAERPLARPYVKDYDAAEIDHPLTWPKRFDLSKWGFLIARQGDLPVGAAAIAHDTPAVLMLEGRSDLAVLWDLRVAPEARGQGLGHALFRRAEAWARARGCRQLKVETQNVNVPACRFYARQGCVLGGLDRFAYPDLPHECQLLWYKEL